LNLLLDENLSPHLRTAIARKCPSVAIWVVGDPGAPPRTSADTDVLLWCDAHDFALVTLNRSTMPVHLAAHVASGGSVPGIFVLRPDLSLGQVADELTLVCEASVPGEFENQIVHLPL
jgi:hypothetical protein